jgi:hypothetical protein
MASSVLRVTSSLMPSCMLLLAELSTVYFQGITQARKT